MRRSGARVTADRAASSAASALARYLVAELGGRYSIELGIDLENGGAEIDRWFLAATLFGSRIPASVATRTYHTLAAAGIATVADVEDRSWTHLVEILDAGGYARYDYRMASRLHALARTVEDRLQGRIETLAGISSARDLEAALDALPGWGPVTIRLFLRELRGIWPGADPRLDPRVEEAARHLGLAGPAESAEGGRWLTSIADAAGLDVRDLEAALVRLSIAHGRQLDTCPGGSDCAFMRRLEARASSRPGRAPARSR